MSYANPRQLKKTYENPFLEGIYSKFKEQVKKDREEQAKTLEEIDAQAVLTANNVGKIDVPGNERLEKQFGELTVLSDHNELKALIRAASGLTGEEKLGNTLEQNRIKESIGDYQGVLTSLDFLSKKLVTASALNPGEKGSLSKTTGAAVMSVIKQFNEGGKNLQFTKDNNQIFLGEIKENGYKVNLSEFTIALGRGEEILKTTMPIKGYEEVASKSLTDVTFAPWKVTVNTDVPLENGGVRSVTEVKIDKDLAKKELMQNGSFNWVKDKTSYSLANQVWSDRMNQETIFNPADETHVLAIKGWLAEDTLDNVIPQTKILADKIIQPEDEKAATKKTTTEKKVKPGKAAAALLAKIKSLKGRGVGSFFEFKGKTVKQTKENEWTLTEEVAGPGGVVSTKVIAKVDDPNKLKDKFGIEDAALVPKEAELDVDMAVDYAMPPSKEEDE